LYNIGCQYEKPNATVEFLFDISIDSLCSRLNLSVFKKKETGKSRYSTNNLKKAEKNHFYLDR
jgi:hypothetical protein